MSGAPSAEEPLTPEEAAFAAQHMGLLKFCAGRVLRWYPGEEFDTLVSDGVAGLLRSVRRFDPSLGFQFSTFATKAITNSMTVEIQKRRTAGRGGGVRPLSLDAPLSEEGDTLASYLAGADDPENDVINDDLARRAIAGLPPRLLRVVPVLLGAVTMTEAAESLGMSVQNVSLLCHRAKERMRFVLEDRREINA